MRPQEFRDLGRHCARRVHLFDLFPPAWAIDHRDGKFRCMKTATVTAKKHDAVQGHGVAAFSVLHQRLTSADLFLRIGASQGG